MKKAFLFIFLSGLLFSTSSNAFFVDSNHDNAFNTIYNLDLTVSKLPIFPSKLKIDYINDFNSENENDEYNSHDSSSCKKIVFNQDSCFRNYLGTLDFVLKVTNVKTYFIENCSHLTRYNFLSLRVLRL